MFLMFSKQLVFLTFLSNIHCCIPLGSPVCGGSKRRHNIYAREGKNVKPYHQIFFVTGAMVYLAHQD